MVRRVYLDDPFFRLVESKITVDGAVVFESTDEDRLRKRVEVVHDAPATPGRHEVNAVQRLKGYGEGGLSYMNHYRFNLPSKHSIDVSRVGGSCVTVTLYFKEDPALPLEERPAIRHDDAWGTHPAAAQHSGSSPPGLDELRKQCSNQVNDACVQIAAKVSKTQPDVAVRIFSEACDANVARGCAELGTAYADGAGLPQDGKRAEEMFEKACRLDPLFCD